METIIITEKYGISRTPTKVVSMANAQMQAVKSWMLCNI